MEELNIFESTYDKPTNKDINVFLNIPDNIKNYSYEIYENNNLIGFRENIKEKTTVTLRENGIFTIKVLLYDENNNITTYESNQYVLDTIPPVISTCYSCYKKTNDYLNGVEAHDNIDGNITTKITTNYKSLKKDNKLIYQVSDEAGNISYSSITLKPKTTQIFPLLLILLIILLVIVKLINKKSLFLEKRYGKYSIKPLKKEELSYKLKLFNLYSEKLNKLSNLLLKSPFIKNYSKRYNKYLSNSTKLKSSIDIVSSKFITSVTFIFILLLYKVLKNQQIYVYEILLSSIVGFFIQDIIYYIRYKQYIKNIESDLLQAIIIMNNAFKSGRSISQAINLVANELKGPISDEFNRISIEIASGMALDEAFKGFASRINIEEVTYLTASLSILNSTGGNIIKVFSSIEHSLFMKKKLRLELKALTSSSKLITKVLFALPLLFVLFISLITPDYFKTLFNSQIGIIVLLFVLIYYIIYVVVVSKIMKVRM